MSALEFYATSGTLRPGAPSYVERPADAELYQALRKGELCYVLTSRQMGKSSLMLRTAIRLREEGWTCILLDLTAIGQNSNPAQWYRGLLRLAGEQLGLIQELDDCWNSAVELSPLQRWLECLRSVILTHCAHVVVFLDEIDLVWGLPFSTDEFFAAIRECQNRRAHDSAFERLTFCLSGVVTPSELIRDYRSTPFNIGRHIALGDFTLNEARPLASGLCAGGTLTGTTVSPSTEHLLRQVLFWTGGHPYLTQRLCKAIADEADRNRNVGKGAALAGRQPASSSCVDAACEALFFSAEAGRREINLLFVRERLLRSGEELPALLQVLARCHAPWGVASAENDPHQDALRLAGVVREIPGRWGPRLHLRNRIYARVFSRKWINKNTPNAERRRQRGAFLRGVWLTAIGAALILSVVGLLALNLKAALRAREDALDSARQDLKRAEAAELKAREAEAHAERARQMAVKQERRARGLQEEALISREESRLRFERLSVARAQDLADAGIPFEGLLWQIEALRMARGHPDREQAHRIRIGALLRDSPKLLQLWRVKTPVWPTALSRRGAHVLAVDGNRQLHLWNARTGAELVTPFPRGIRFAAFSPDGSQIAARTEKAIYLWRLGGSMRYRPTPPGGFTKMAFSPDGGRVLVSEGPTGVCILNTATANLLGKTWEHPSPVRFACFSPDGALVATGCRDMSLRVWKAGDGQLQYGPLPGDREVVELVLDNTGKRLLVYGDNSARLWNLETGLSIGTLDGNRISSRPFSTDGKRLVTLSGYEVRLWDAETGRPLGPVLPQTQEVLDAGFVVGSTQVVSLTRDGRSHRWDGERGLLISSGPVLSGRGCSGVISNQQSMQLLSDGSGEIRLWGPTTECPPFWTLATPSPSAVSCFSSDGRSLITACADGVARLCPVEPGGGPSLSLPHGPGLKFAAFSPDGTRVVTTGTDGTARLWSSKTGRPVGRALRHSGGVAHAAFSPDGRRLATAIYPQDVQVWDLSTSKVCLRQQHAGSLPRRLWFDVSGRRLYSLNEDGDVYESMGGGKLTPIPELRRLFHLSPWSWDPGTRAACVLPDGSALAWDFRSRRGRGPFVMNGSIARCARLDSSGKLMATGGDDLTARIWEVATGKPLCAPLRHARAVTNLAFSPDGKQLATLTVDGTARVWESATGDPLTPPLFGRHFRGEVRFNPTGNRLLVTQENGDAQVWDLSPDGRPAEHLAQLAEVLAGQVIEAGAGVAPTAGADPPSIFSQLKVRYPGTFRTLAAQEEATLRARASDAENRLLWYVATDELDALLLKRPHDRELYRRRARARCEVGNWKGAAGDFARAVHNGANDYLVWYQMALCRLLSDQSKGYALACEAMLDRFERTGQPRERDLAAWTCALAPLPENTLRRALRLIDGLLQGSPENVDWLQTRAFLLYRADRASEAHDALEHARRARGHDGKATDLLLAALIQSRLGHQTNAIRVYHLAATEEEGPTPAGHHLLWDERGELILFRREVAAVLGGRATPAAH